MSEAKIFTANPDEDTIDWTEADVKKLHEMLAADDNVALLGSGAVEGAAQPEPAALEQPVQAAEQQSGRGVGVMRFLVTAGSVLLAGAFMAKGYTQRATEAKAALEDAKRRGASAGEIRRLDRNARAAVSAGEEQLRREKANRTKNDHLSRHGVPDKDQAVN